MAIKISATQAAREFSEVLSRVHYQGTEYLVERSGRVICRISPAGARGRTFGDLVSVLRDAPRPDAGFGDTVLEATRDQPPAPEDPWPS